MSIPGSNLLSIALSVITPQSIALSRALSRTQNAVGEWVTTYAAQIPVEGSWQPVDRTKYEALGLDLMKNYYTFYTSEPIKSINRGDSPDLCERNGRKYSAIGDVPWNDIDGWQSVTFVDIGAAD